MNTKEIRQKYLEFFKSKEHTIIPSASIMPENATHGSLFIRRGTSSWNKGN